MITLDQQLAEARREISMRKRVYPRRVESGRMTQADADSRISTMAAIRDTLAGLVEDENERREPKLI